MLPPVSITDPDYQAEGRANGSDPRARASEMEHAIRHHISVHMAEDPARYRRLSERLEQILAEHRATGNSRLRPSAACSMRSPARKPNVEPVVTRPGPAVEESALYGVVAGEDRDRWRHRRTARGQTRRGFRPPPVQPGRHADDHAGGLLAARRWIRTTSSGDHGRPNRRQHLPARPGRRPGRRAIRGHQGKPQAHPAAEPRETRYALA